MLLAHQFRFDGINHTVASSRSRVRRSSNPVTLCGLTVTDAWIRRPATGSPTTCDVCGDAIDAYVDVLDD